MKSSASDLTEVPSEELQTDGPVFLEIGFGGLPAYSPLGEVGHSDKYKGIHYIGIDMDHEIVADAKANLKRFGGLDEAASIGLHALPIAELELPDESVDEIYMANVFAGAASAQNVHITHRMGLPVWTGEWSAFRGKKPFTDLVEQLPKLHSFLKQAGQLTLVETNCATPLEVMVEALSKAGFEIEEVVNRSTQRWAELLTDYGVLDDVASLFDDPYILIARKSPVNHDKT